jgi:hypothetical protein
MPDTPKILTEEEIKALPMRIEPDPIVAYWHEAGHVLVTRTLDVPVAGVIYNDLKRLPDSRVKGYLATMYYPTQHTSPERLAAEEAEWIRHFGLGVCPSIQP